MKKKYIFYFFLLTLYFLAGYYLLSKHQNKILTLLHITEPVEIKSSSINMTKKNNTQKTIIAIPKGYQPIQDYLQQTSYTGTPDHPTIDGGIINNSDGLPVSHNEPKELIMTVPIEHTLSNSKQKPFQDSWVNSQKVKQILETAANEGKLKYVLKKTDEIGLPASIAILPMIESQYKINAVSEKGAAGAWQLMPSVAKQYGISNQERFQFSTSTDVALKLLVDLHQRFKNWNLAFAAYNAGSQRITTALQTNPRATNINDLDIPAETKNYVNRIKEINDVMAGLYELGA
jgi:hypothetical protein